MRIAGKVFCLGQESDRRRIYAVFNFDTEIKRQTGTDGKEYKVCNGTFYSAEALDGVPIRVLFPKRLIEDKELFFTCSLEKDYRISGNLELEVGRGTGIKDYYIIVHAFNSVEERTEEENDKSAGEQNG